jgi:tetratricopeptide (TPR) repeat protein
MEVADSGATSGRDSLLSGAYVAGRDLILGSSASQPPATDVFELPRDLLDFTGRDEAVTDLLSMLEWDNRRATAVVVSAIVGKAGVGKTALATHVAHQLRGSYPDGQLYVNLRGAEREQLDPSEVLAGFLRALGVDGAAIPGQLDERARRFRARLADRRVLIVLDNASGPAQVGPLLPGTPGCAAVITSRSWLGGLPAQSMELDVLDIDQALDLLARLAGQERVTAQLEDARTIVQLCGRLPLALRIAGAKLASRPNWSLRRLVDSLRDERQRLDHLRVGNDEVRSSFALSYEGLPGAQKQAFRMLGLVRAPDFTSWVAAALLNVELRHADDLVDGLYEARLLEEIGEDGTGQLRYRFHDLLRVFARERLKAEEPPAERQAARERALNAYLAVAEAAADRIEPAGTAEPGRAARWPATKPSIEQMIERNPAGWFRVELPGLVAATEQAYRHGLWEVVWELANALSYVLNVWSIRRDWQHTQALALEAARQAGNRHAEATALLGLGTVYREQDEWGEAATRFEGSLQVFRDLGDRHGEAWALSRLGDVHIEQNRLPEAAQHLAEAIELFKDVGDQTRAAWTRYHLGIIARIQGQFSGAVKHFEQCRAAFTSVRDRRGEAQSLHNLGIVYREQESFEKALTCFEAALLIFVELDDRRWALYVPHNLGIVSREQGRLREAATYLGECLTGFRQLHDRGGEAWTLLHLGIVFRVQGLLDKSRRCFNQCLEIFAEQNDRSGIAMTHVSVGDLHLGEGDLEAALAELDRALPVLRELNDRLSTARALRSYGMVVAAKGERAGAMAAWRDALELFRQLGVQRSAADLAAVVAAAQDPDQSDQQG